MPFTEETSITDMQFLKALLVAAQMVGPRALSLVEMVEKAEKAAGLIVAK